MEQQMPDHLKLLCDFSELSWVFNSSQSIETFFNRLVDMVADHMRTRVCSLYLYDQDRYELFLQATHGLKEHAAGRIRMRADEGLTGKSLALKKSVVVEQASRDPAYKFFGDVDEELYEAFMAVPILRGIKEIGVLVLQREELKPFVRDEVTVTQTIASQLANIIENARLLTQAEKRTEKISGLTLPELKIVRGKKASEGLVQGKAIVRRRHQDLEEYLAALEKNSFAPIDFREALKVTETQLETIQTEVEERLSDVASLIFSAHLLMLKDRGLISRIETGIAGGSSPGKAIVEAANYYIDRFLRVEDHYIREKADDVRDLTVRLLDNLFVRDRGFDDLSERILIADQLLPSDILKLSYEKILGVILVSGGVTSHVALLARSLGMPLVIADEPRLLDIGRDVLILLDATIGNIHVSPETPVIEAFARRKAEEAIAEEQTWPDESLTRDNRRIHLYCNINLLSDLQGAVKYGAEGIGLYRSEIPFLVRSDFPSEEEQFQVYRRLVAGLPGKPLVFRTLDVGGDKVLSYYHQEREDNPFLGMRSIRFSLKHRDIFARQLRALLRAGHDTDLRIMFPMISSLEDFREARQILFTCQDELRNEGRDFCSHPRLGVMVEIPGVVDILDALACETDFFSIGSNDLIQYLLAVDRTNEKVSDFYIPHHPSVLRTIARIVQAAERCGVPVSICGEMASRRLYLPFLLGIGIRNLSMEPVYLPRIRKALTSIDLVRAQSFSENLLAMTTVSEIFEELENFWNE